MSDRVLAVLNGRDFPLESLAEWARSATLVGAADGAADRLRSAGTPPDFVIGDLDSLKGDPAMFSGKVLADSDQDTTDADKLLTYLKGLGHRKITVVGLEGDRLDHVLSSLNSVHTSGLNVRLILRRSVAYFVTPASSLRIQSRPSQRCSLIPFGSTRAVWNGVQWPLQGEVLRLGAALSISNRATEEEMNLQILEGAGFLFLESEGIPTSTWD